MDVMTSLSDSTETGRPGPKPQRDLMGGVDPRFPTRYGEASPALQQILMPYLCEVTSPQTLIFDARDTKRPPNHHVRLPAELKKGFIFCDASGGGCGRRDEGFQR